jgi:type I restriction enzyme S subunit
MDSRYIEAFLRSKHAQTEIDRMKTGISDSGLNLTHGRFLPLQVPVAPLNEQERIVAKIEELFSDLDAGVAALERAKANLKRYRAAVLKAAVEGKLTQKWRAENPPKEPASKLLARILKERRKKWEQEQLAAYKAKGKQPPKNWRDKYKEPAGPGANLPALPEGWCWACLSQLLAEPLRNGHSAKRSKDGTGVRTPYAHGNNGWRFLGEEHETDRRKPRQSGRPLAETRRHLHRAVEHARACWHSPTISWAMQIRHFSRPADPGENNAPCVRRVR